MTDTLIVGAGLAGMAAAVMLSDAGRNVIVLEARQEVGGRTSSWNDDGMYIESGFHRFLGFYTALPDLLKKVGVSLDDILCWEDEVEIRIPDGGIHSTFGLAPLHKPFKTVWAAFGHNNFLSPKDKLALGKMFASGAKDYVANPKELDTRTAGDYARDHGVSEEAIHRLVTPLTEGIFFVSAEEYSMYNLMGLFLPYLKSLPKLRVGAFTGGMSDVMMRPMVDYVVGHGGEVRCNAPVKKLITKNGKVVGVETNDGVLEAKHVILAASLYGAQKIIAASEVDQAKFKNMLKLDTMPAVTFQIELLKPSMELDRTTFGPGTCMTSFAEQSRTTFPQSKGRLSVILSPPEKFIHMSEERILKIVMRDAKRLKIDLEGIVVDCRKVVWEHDFYSLRTGNEHLRPKQSTGIPGLALTGDYTKQPYLATMEGAVVSGKLAASLVLKNSAG